MGEIAPGSSDAAAAAVPGVPEPIGLRLRYALATLLFTVAYHVFGLRRAVTRQNLQRSFPGLDATALRRLQREFVRRQAEIFAEMTYGANIDAEELRARVRIVDDDLLAAASGPRPLILAAAHQCNFEWVVLRVSLDLGPRLLALYKPLRNGWAERLFKRWRARFGATLVPAKSVLRELARYREAAAIGIVADQVPRTSPEKHWLEFLHQDTAFYMGPELLGRALRSQVVYVSMRRLGRGRYEIELQPLNTAGEKLPGGEITARYAHALERDIRNDPAGWWWSHKRWKLHR
jgi:KDO2-lipid IV(A) lauroyltransferase